MHKEQKEGEFWIAQEILLMIGTEIFPFRPLGAKKKGFEVGNPMFENTTKFTFHQFDPGLDPFSLSLVRLRLG